MSGAMSEAESRAVDELMGSLPMVKLAFVFFMVASSWTLLSILTAVVSDNMMSTTGEDEAEQKLEGDDEDRAEHRRDLTQLFTRMDTANDGEVHLEDTKSFLKKKDNAIESAKRC